MVPFSTLLMAASPQVSVAERPITQQGLQGLKTGGSPSFEVLTCPFKLKCYRSPLDCHPEKIQQCVKGGRGPQRQFQDKSYFLGALR